MENKEKIKLTGEIYHIGQIEQVSEKFKKRDFVIKTVEQYPQFVLLQVVNDRVNLLDNLRFNDAVDCFINIRGREWTDKNTGAKKFFNTLEAWSIQFANITNRPPVQNGPINVNLQPQPAQPIQPAQQPQINNLDPLGLLSNNNDDLPF